MKNYFRQIFVALWLVILNSCETNIIDDYDKVTPGLDFAVTETTKDYSITYKFNDNVIVLNDKNSSYLVKVENDSILFFSKSTPSNIIPEIGSIISSKITEKNPYGLGNVVLEKSEVNGMIKCVTTVAPLDDIFKELELTSNFSLIDLVKDTTGFYDDEGNYYEIEIKNEELFTDSLSDSFEVSSSSTRVSLGSRKILEIPIKVTTSSGLFTDIKLQIGGIVTFNKSKEQNTFENSLEVSLGIKGDLGWKTGKDKTSDLTLQVAKILKLIKKTKIIEGNLPIAGGLINLRPFIDFEANLIGGINGTFAVGCGYSLGYKCGWTENGFFKENTSTEPKVGNIFNSFTLNGKGQIGPEAVFHLGCGLYTKNIAMLLNVKPSLTIGAELGISGQRSDNIWQIQGQSVNVDVAVGIDGEITANLFGKDFYKDSVSLANINLFNVRFPIFPEIKSGSFNIEKKNSDPLVFDAEYTITGGVIAKLLGGIPTLRVEKAGNEVYHIVNGQEIYYTEPSHLSYELTGLNKKTTYTAVPSIMIGNMWFDWNGKSFSDNEEDERLDDVIPEDIRDKIDDYIPIYNGVNPPNVEGTFYICPMTTVYCEDGNYYPGQEINSFYVNFFNQNMENNTLDYTGWHESAIASESGNGVFISGTGNNFSIFFNTIGQTEGIATKTALVISGTKTESGIKDLYYAFVMIEKGADPNHYLMDEGIYRVFKDGDGLSEPASNASYTRAKVIQSSLFDRISPIMCGKFFKK